MTQRISTGLVAGLLLAMTVAGCGTADDGDGVASAGGDASSAPSTSKGPKDEREQMLKFAQCMRDNGVPEFPDPEINEGGGVNLNLPEGTDKQAVDAAQEKCKKYMPNGGEPQKADPEVVAQLREYSKCMRENGVPKFPDPTDGGLQINNDEIGVGPNDPTYKAADQKCSHLMPKPPEGGEGPSLNDGGGR
ncbi:MAG: hypothetical protein GEV28_06865 [Actinophytocola sp.]|uniref:hypothetical protein n=1 Tax=Actinophytocola sp. TaxID=1872138 RepID=UPI00132B53FD|nr:hypothetical protein [Actinophytocola sp.]MPZ80115.1 hypothetical protein [Actinophytocola sp.]